MDLISEDDNTLSTVFASTIREDRLITIPIEIREYFKIYYNINLDNGTIIKVKIKAQTKESDFFPKEITTGYRIRIPKDAIDFNNFHLNESIEVQIIVSKNKENKDV